MSVSGRMHHRRTISPKILYERATPLLQGQLSQDPNMVVKMKSRFFLSFSVL